MGPGDKSGTFIPGWLPTGTTDLYSSQEALPLLFSSVPQVWNVASPLETGLELLFQGGSPWYHLICTPLRRGLSSCFPQPPGTVEYGPHALRQVWNFYSRVATPGTSWVPSP